MDITESEKWMAACLLMALMQATCTQEKKVKYADIYDPVADVGQYKLPSLSRTPKVCWDIAVEGDNLSDYLLAASITGLTARALEKGKTDVGVCIDKPDSVRTDFLKSTP